MLALASLPPLPPAHSFCISLASPDRLPLPPSPPQQAIVAELTKLGATVEEGHDYCVITPPKEARVCLAWPLALLVIRPAGRSVGRCPCEDHPPAAAD